MQSKAIENNAANVIVSSAFKTANSMASAGKSFNGFVDYTEREEAVELDLKREFDDYDKYQDFGGYVGYMDRDSATSIDEQGNHLTSNFNGEKDHLSESDVKKLKGQLQTAQDNNSNIYAHVISFSTKFLKDNGIYDDKTNKLDQKALREIVRGSMNDFVKATPLKNPIWWGDVHVNTDHIHVHIGMTEVRPTTKEILVGDHKEYRGKLPQKSFDVLKQKVVRRTLEIGHNQELNHTLSLEKDTSYLRQRTIKSIDNNQINLQRLMMALPRDKKLWRYGSNAKEMFKAKEILKDVIKDFKQNSEDYQTWLKNTTELMEIANENYGKNDGLLNRISDLDQRLGNHILQMCRDASDDDLKLSVDNLAKDYSEEAIRDNQQRIKDISAKLRELKEFNDPNDLKEISTLGKELKTRKIGLKRQNAKNKISGLKENLKNIEAIDTRGLEVQPKHVFNKLAEIATKDLSEQIELEKLKLKPPFELINEEQKQLKELDNRFVDAINVPIDKVNAQMVKEVERRSKRLPNLRDVAKTKAFKELEKEYPYLNIRENERSIVVIQLKYKIKQNKDKGIDNLANYRKLKKLTGDTAKRKGRMGRFIKHGGFGKNANKNLRIFKNAQIQTKKLANNLSKTVKEAMRDIESEVQSISQRQRKEKEAMNRMLDENRREDQERGR